MKKICLLISILLILSMGFGCKKLEPINMQSVETENEVIKVQLEFKNIDTKNNFLKGNAFIVNKSNSKISIRINSICLISKGWEVETNYDSFADIMAVTFPGNSTGNIPVYWAIKKSGLIEFNGDYGVIIKKGFLLPNSNSEQILKKQKKGAAAKEPEVK